MNLDGGFGARTPGDVPNRLQLGLTMVPKIKFYAYAAIGWLGSRPGSSITFTGLGAAKYSTNRRVSLCLMAIGAYL